MGRQAHWTGENLKNLLTKDLDELTKLYPQFTRNHLSATKRYWSKKMERQPRARTTNRELGELVIGSLITPEERSRYHAELDRALDEYGHVSKARFTDSQMGYKDAEGEARTHQLHHQSFEVAFNHEPKWPLITQARPEYRIPKFERKNDISDKGVAFITPDNQIHYWQLADGRLEPFHDIYVHALSLQIMRDLKPDVAIGLGDFLDLPSYNTKYIQEPAFAHTTNLAMRFGHNYMALKKGMSPKTKLVEIAGNHDYRADTYAKANATASFGLKRANESSDWPVLSVPYLCNFESLDIEYVDGYPNDAYWLTDTMKFVHAPETKVANSERVSYVHGHTHRRTLVEETLNTRYGAFNRFVASPGTMSRIDGFVPSTKGAMRLSGEPVRKFENWQQGFAVVEYDKTTGAVDYHPIRVDTFNNYQTRFNGKTYTPDPDLVAEMQSWATRIG